METQKSITDWQLETFGEDSRDGKTMVLRTFEEMVELAHAAGIDQDSLYYVLIDVYNKNKSPNVVEEIADVAIMLQGTASCYMVQVQEIVDLKMSINRNRKWHRRNDGHHQHTDSE